MITIHEKWALLFMDGPEDLKHKISDWRKKYAMPVDRLVSKALLDGDVVDLDVKAVDVKPEWASGDMSKTEANVAFWYRLLKDYDRVLGEFPPEAVEALEHLRERYRSDVAFDVFKIDKYSLPKYGRVLSPVIRDGKVVRWAKV